MRCGDVFKRRSLMFPTFAIWSFSGGFCKFYASKFVRAHDRVATGATGGDRATWRRLVGAEVNLLFPGTVGVLGTTWLHLSRPSRRSNGRRKTGDVACGRRRGDVCPLYIKVLDAVNCPTHT